MKQIIAFLFCSALFSAQLPDELKINQIQVIGSHNSYKKAFDPQVYSYLSQKDGNNKLQDLQYEHWPLETQLDLGLRNLEIDVYADSLGGRYSRPKIKELLNLPLPEGFTNIMNQPGYKIIHIPDVDFESWYLTLEQMLTALRNWSDSNPGHTPIFITLEPKTGDKSLFGTEIEAYNSKLFDQLDEDLKKFLGREKIITPDDVRGNFNTLNSAVRKGNWPKLATARGKFLFILDKTGKERDIYARNHPSLKGRMIFTNSEPGTPEAATLILNNANDPLIPKYAKEGYIIRTRADANTTEARNNDFSKFEAAKKSGAQIITTDYYFMSRFFPSRFRVVFDNCGYERINPLTK